MHIRIHKQSTRRLENNFLNIQLALCFNLKQFNFVGFELNDRKVNFKCQFQIERHKIKITTTETVYMYVCMYIDDNNNNNKGRVIRIK